MRRLIFAVVLVFVMSAGAFAASEDMRVYVRQDVFDAKMETLLTRIEGKIDALSEKIDGVEKSLSEKIDGVDKKLSERIDGVEKSLSEKIDGVDKKLSEKIDGVDKKLSARMDGLDRRIGGLDKRIDDTHTYIYWILVLLGAIFIMPFVNKFWEFRREHRTPAVTIEDVQRIVMEAISENNARVRG